MSVSERQNVEDVYGPGAADVYVHAAALYVALLKNEYSDEAAEFAEWFIETFDIDLET